MNKKDIIICRCEDIRLTDLEQMFQAGYTDLEEIKRLLRIGMGPCQGTTCSHLVQRELAKFLKVNVSELKTTTFRPPVMGVKLASIKEGTSDES
ncbi:MAG: (2Fe-2S)-binding protein [Bacilli bacterium]|nr:(2Fe-2S)-binding protein [Bacilli bacterium]